MSSKISEVGFKISERERGTFLLVAIFSKNKIPYPKHNKYCTSYRQAYQTNKSCNTIQANLKRVKA
jgi:hypothetical protein